jgi:transposase-like protein
MRKFDKEFKKEAVKKCLDGQSVASVSREIGVNGNTIHRWKTEMIPEIRGGNEDYVKLKKRIIELEMGNEILKKATAIFVRSG